MPLLVPYSRTQSVPGSTNQQKVNPAVHLNSGLGEMLDKASAQIEAANARLEARNDVVQLELAKSAFNDRMTADALDFQQTEDLRDPSVLKTYGGRMAGIRAEVLQGFKGSADARAQLEAGLIGAASGYQRQMITHSRNAQKAFITDTIEKDIQSASKTVNENPAALIEQIDVVTDAIRARGNALTYQEEAMQVDAAWNILGTAALDSFISRGDYEGAQLLLEQNPAVSGALSTETYRRYQNEIQGARHAEMKENRAMMAKANQIQMLAQQFGVRVSGAQMFSAITGVKVPQGYGPDKKAIQLQRLAKALNKDVSELPENLVIGVYAGADMAKLMGGGGPTAADQNKKVGADGKLTAFGILESTKGDMAHALRIDSARAQVLAGIEEWRQTGNNSALMAANQSFLKMLDDGAVVRGEDFRMQQQAQSTVDQLKAFFELSEKGGPLTRDQVDQVQNATLGFSNALLDRKYNKLKPYKTRADAEKMDNLTTGLHNDTWNDIFSDQVRTGGPVDQGKEPGRVKPKDPSDAAHGASPSVSNEERTAASKSVANSAPKKLPRRFKAGLDGSFTEVNQNDVPNILIDGDSEDLKKGEIGSSVPWDQLSDDERKHYKTKEDYELFMGGS